MYIASGNSSSSAIAKADAVCNGTNDTQVIQQALNKGGLVQLADGVFTVAGLHPISGSGLCGSGMGVTIVRRASGCIGNLIDCLNAEMVSVGDLTIDDVRLAVPEPANIPIALRFYRCKHAFAERVHVKNTWRFGIVIGRSSFATLSECVVQDAQGTRLIDASGNRIPGGGKGGHGIAVTSEAEPCRSIRITDCTLTGNWRTGIYVTMVNGCVISRNALDNNCPQEAVDAKIERGGQIAGAYGATNLTIAENVITGGADTQGVEIDITENGVPTAAVSQRITIRDNKISGQGFPAILLYGDPSADAAHCQAFAEISGNILSRNNRRGNNWYGAITVTQKITDFAIMSNQITDDMPGCPGIRLHGMNDQYQIANNRVALTFPQGSPVTLPIVDGNYSSSVKRYVSGNLPSVVYVTA